MTKTLEASNERAPGAESSGVCAEFSAGGMACLFPDQEGEEGWRRSPGPGFMGHAFIHSLVVPEGPATSQGPSWDWRYRVGKRAVRTYVHSSGGPERKQ